MKTYKNSLTRFARVVTVGTALGAATLAGPALQAQNATTEPPQAGAAQPYDNTASHRAKEFLREAAQANQTEIAMANVAESRSQNASVKELAQMMVNDHQGNLAQVQRLAQDHGIALDASLDMMNQHEVNRLQKCEAADFDKDYAKLMLKDHVKVIKRFDKALADIKEPYVQDYAQTTLPALRKHLRHSEETARSVGLEESTISSILKDLPSDENGRAIGFNQN